jgi:hypothetical protein
MKAAIAKLIFQVHRLPKPENKFEFDEQVIVIPGDSQETRLNDALKWAYSYEAENNRMPSEGLVWEFIGIREMIPFQLGVKALPLCSGSLFMEEEESFKEHVRLKSGALEKTFQLFS